MVKFIKLVYLFIKELFVDKKEQMHFYSAQFNAIRWSQVVMTLVLLVLLIFSDRALIHLSYRILKQDKLIHQLNSQHVLDQAEILKLQESESACKQ